MKKKSWNYSLKSFSKILALHVEIFSYFSNNTQFHLEHREVNTTKDNCSRAKRRKLQKKRRSNIVWLVALWNFQCHWPIKSLLLSLRFHRKNCFVRRLFIVKKKNYLRKWTSYRYIGKPGENESKTRIEEVYVNDHQHRRCNWNFLSIACAAVNTFPNCEQFQCWKLFSLCFGN